MNVNGVSAPLEDKGLKNNGKIINQTVSSFCLYIGRAIIYVYLSSSLQGAVSHVIVAQPGNTDHKPKEVVIRNTITRAFRPLINGSLMPLFVGGV